MLLLLPPLHVCCQVRMQLLLQLSHGPSFGACLLLPQVVLLPLLQQLLLLLSLPLGAA
jgi:hypothetical protein